jgi:glycosyltransferase involved in cell wall biosynthesis
VLIFAGNLHKGGGVAVSVSVIKNLIFDDTDLHAYELCVSSEVDAGLTNAGVDCRLPFANYYVMDFNFLSLLNPSFNKFINSYSRIYVLFGPLYTFARFKNISQGFARADILMSSGHWGFMDVASNFRKYLKWFVILLFFSKSNRIVVESDFVKHAIRSVPLMNKIPISVISSSVDEVFLSKDRWSQLELKEVESIRLGLIARDYPHKHLEVFPVVKEILFKKFDLQVEFLVTLTDQEWQLKDNSFRNSVMNVGPLYLSECPAFYEALDGVFFPSTAECFSAVTIESMFMRKPLFCSNMPFNSSIMGYNAIYFNPMDCDDMALSIASYFARPFAKRSAFVNAAYSENTKYFSSSARAGRHFEFIKKMG